MKIDSSRWFVLGGLGLIVVRALWEWFDPLMPYEFKGMVYLRDIVVLFPAAILLLMGGRPSKERQQEPSKPLVLSLFKCRQGVYAFVLSVVLFIACSLISFFVYKTLAHILDEANYLVQAKLFATGKLWFSPTQYMPTEFFSLKYFVQTPDKWYGGFFPGQSALLAIGYLFGVPWLVNPLLSGVLVCVTVWAGSRLFSSATGRLAGLLMLLSPFVLLQGASYFSHVATAILITVGFVVLIRSSVSSVVCPLWVGGLIGATILFRPLSAAVLGVFAVGWILIKLKHESSESRKLLRYFTLLVMGVMPGAILFLVYNRLLTGSFLVTPHHVACPGESMGFGVHSVINTLINFTGLSVDLFGVPVLSLVLVLFYFWTRDRWSIPIFVFMALYCGAYSIYPYHGLSYGPRFYYELVPLLIVAAGQGITGLSKEPWRNVCPNTVRLIVIIAVVSVFGVLPSRIAVFRRRANYYDIAPIVKSGVEEPAVVLVENSDKARLFPYMSGFQLNNADFGGSIIYMRSLPKRNAELLTGYPEREFYLLDLDAVKLTPYEPL